MRCKFVIEWRNGEFHMQTSKLEIYKLFFACLEKKIRLSLLSLK